MNKNRSPQKITAGRDAIVEKFSEISKLVHGWTTSNMDS